MKVDVSDNSDCCTKKEKCKTYVATYVHTSHTQGSHWYKRAKVEHVGTIDLMHFNHNVGF